MASRGTILEPINTVAGVQPVTDKTSVKTPHFTYADKIRFQNGDVKKIGGWDSVLFDYSKTIVGTARSLFAEIINGQYYNIIGTDKKLYSLIGSVLTNITPLETTSTAIANSLATHFDTLGTDPMTAVLGSPIVTITDSDADRFEAGDTVYFTGATAFAGLGIGLLNGDHIIRSVGSGIYTINVGTDATSSASGGGSSVDRASGLVEVTSASHALLDGSRVSIEDAATFGGITAGEINREHIIRNVDTNTFDVMTTGEATSSVTSGGGASTIYYEEIPAGALDEGNVIGYGAGLYGVGLYGTALVSTTSRTLPRIWFMDRYAAQVVMTAGNQTGVYIWDGDNSVAPTLVPNAPTEVNYAFISDNILVVLGEDDVENRITGSDQNDIEEWTGSSLNQVFRDDIEGAGRLLSHIPLEDENLILGENKTFRLRYIGLPAVWEITKLDNTVGIIAPMARVEAKGMGFWMGIDNFYMYRGGTVEVIPANSQEQSTALKYVFDNLNYGQKSKCFGWYNKAFNEVWFHYLSAESNECDRVVVVNILDFTWTVHLLDRTCAEYPDSKSNNPKLMNVGDLYRHETGTNADGVALPFTITGNKRFYGKDNININAIVPDSITDHDLTFTNEGTLYPQSSITSYTNQQTVTTTTDRLPVLNSSRFHQYTWAGSELDQDWIMGQWFEEIQKASPE